MNTERFAQVFPFGSHLCREPMPPMAELKHDMEILKKNGFNLVKLQEHWMVDEPLEGQYDFSRYEELIAHAERLDMGVYLGLTCEQAPGWLYRKHPERLGKMLREDPIVAAYPLFLLGLPLTLKWRAYPLLLAVPLWRNRGKQPVRVVVDHLWFGVGVLRELGHAARGVAA